jgi:hypothetical protein
MRRGAGRIAFGLTALAVPFVLAACGGGSRQDANEPSGRFPVSITSASFPASQRLAERSQLVIAVHNAGNRTIPNVAVTICNVTCRYPARVGQGTSVKAFAQYLNMPGLANHSRPVWIIDRPPGLCGYSCVNGGRGGAFSADANTWALGSLKPGRTAVFRWGVTAVAPGRHVVAWEVAAGLYGKAKAVLPDGSQPQGSFTVRIAQAPAQSYVNDSGQIVSSK